jgi:hypothetical protein
MVAAFSFWPAGMALEKFDILEKTTYQKNNQRRLILYYSLEINSKHW